MGRRAVRRDEGWKQLQKPDEGYSTRCRSYLEGDSARMVILVGDMTILGSAGQGVWMGNQKWLPRIGVLWKLRVALGLNLAMRRFHFRDKSQRANRGLRE